MRRRGGSAIVPAALVGIYAGLSIRPKDKVRI